MDGYIPANLTMTEPQRVNIQWMPRHYRMPSNITTYDLKVCKVPDGYEPTEALDACVNPVIDDKGNPGTFYPGNTGIGNSLIGALERGARYAARVTVHEFDTDGHEVVFVNEGRSEVNWFRYGKECASLESFVITETGPGRLQLNWEAVTAAGQADMDNCKVLYRKTGETKWAVTPGELADYYVNFPRVDGIVPSDTAGKLKLPGCALQSSAFSVCSPEHPMVPLQTGQDGADKPENLGCMILLFL